MYHHMCICPGLANCLRAWISPLKAITTSQLDTFICLLFHSVVTLQHYMCHTGYHSHYMYRHIMCVLVLQFVYGMNLPLESNHHQPVKHIHYVYCSTLLSDTTCVTLATIAIYVSPMCICPGLVICLRAFICPLKATISLWDAIHAYLHVVHPGITLYSLSLGNAEWHD